MELIRSSPCDALHVIPKWTSINWFRPVPIQDIDYNRFSDMERKKYPMLTMRKYKFPSILLLLGLTLAACGPGAAELTPTVNPQLIRTEAVATYSFSLTETALAIPTETATPTPTLTETPLPAGTVSTVKPTASCYGLLWLADVTIPDNTAMTAGQTFTKTWRVQNTGSCAWAPGFTLTWIGGDAMSGQALTLTEAVPIGAKKELSINMTAPTGKTGTIQGTWKMVDADGGLFGDALFVIIVVGGTNTTGTPSGAAATSAPSAAPTNTP